MAGRVRWFTKRFFIITNIVVVFVFLLACLIPFLNPKHWWFISFLGMGFPLILVAVLAHTVLWLLTRKYKIALLSLLPIFIGWKSVSVVFAVHYSEKFDREKPHDVLRVLSWNVAQFRETAVNNNKGSQTRKLMLAQIKAQNADIVCLQEFYTSESKKFYNNIEPLKEMGYPHVAHFKNDKIANTSAIFSKYNIINAGFTDYPQPTYPDRLVFADIVKGNDTIRVFSTHLESVRFREDDYVKIEEIKEGNDGIVENAKSLFRKWKNSAANRAVQVNIIKEQVEASPYPKIFTGDINDVPNSYTYFNVRGNMQDAFLKKSRGFGRTFSAISPTLRIDYIFAEKDFSVKQFKRTVNNYSDHYMIVADLAWKKKK